MELIEPWDQQENESAGPYRAFCIYRDMGRGRNVRTLAKSEDRPAGYATLAKWSVKHGWVDRAWQWDQEQARISHTRALMKVADMRQSHAAIGVLMLSKAMARFEKINPERLTIKEAIQLAELGAKLEHASRTPDLIPEQPGTPEQQKAADQPAVSSADLWRLLQSNPHLSDALKQLDEACDDGPSSVPALPAGDSDDEITDAELVDDDEAEAV